MASAISQSSVATIVEDLVSDRNISLKICMIVLNCLQILSSWVAIGLLCIVIQEWTPMEVGVSGGFLIVGNYIIPGIANGIIYWRRWHRSSNANRRRMEEENKQAWVCLRIALSLLGIPTVGRYIETIMVSRKLDELEKKHLQTSVTMHKEGSQLHPVGTSRLGAIINQKNYEKMSKAEKSQSIVSGAAAQSNLQNMNENSQEKVRRARRQYKRCEHDGSQMALLAGSTGGGPLAVAFAVLYMQRIDKVNMSNDQGAAVIVSAVLNVLWLCATLTHFYPARHVQSEAEFERGVRHTHIGSLILLYCSHLVQVVLRIICLSIFANYFLSYVLIVVVFHWLVGIVITLSYRCYMKSKVVGRSVISCSSFLSAVFIGYVGVFDFVNGNEGKTRMRYLIYYAFYYIENIIMLVIWIIMFPKSQIQFPIPFVCVVLGLFWLGFFLLQLYLYYYSYSPYGSSIFRCCKKESHKKSANYVEEVREPVFGIPLAQSAIPLWQNQHPPHTDVGNESRISGISNQNYKLAKPSPVNYHKTPSIMSMQPSILSQPGSFTNLKNEKPKINPSLKTPPVVEHKSKLQNPKPVSKRDFSSDSSSSSSEESQKFTPKPNKNFRSHPNLANPIPSTTPSQEEEEDNHSPNTDSTEIKDHVKPEPARLLSNHRGSKSLDHIAYMIPAMEPNKRTKPIGFAPMIQSAQGPKNPHRQVKPPRNPHQHRRNHNSLKPSNMRTIR